jgi:pSer/pThr/pTyr-binding forkhead associated (FHA) protein
MQVKLKVLAGSSEGKEIAVNTDKFLIGRADECQLRPKSESVSRRHCALVQKDGRVLLIDLKSRNGTFVNEKQLSADKAKILKDGDILRVGKLEFQIAIEVGIGGAKKAEVKDIKEAADRAAQVSSTDSKFEQIDISQWLEEADSIQRTKTEPETRQLVLDDTTRISGEGDKQDAVATHDSKEIEESSQKNQLKRPEKKPPQKLPKSASGPSTGSSQDAANETLKKFFGGR